MNPKAIELRPYQQELVNKIGQAYKSGFKCPLAVLSTGGGKCLARGTPVLMYDWSIRPVESIKNKELVMGPDGGPREVLKRSSGWEMMFKISQEYGDDYTVNKSHILSLKIVGAKEPVRSFGNKVHYDGDIVNLDVISYLATSARFKQYAKGWKAWPYFKKGASAEEQESTTTNITVTRVGIGKYFGFELQGKDRLFLLGDFTVTHNTVIFSHITQGASQKGNPVLVAAHRKEIIRQISLSLARFGVAHQIIAPPARAASIRIAHVRAYGKCFVDKKSTVLVGSTQTLINRLDQVRSVFESAKQTNPNARPLIVFDEAHHAVPGTQHGKIMEFAERLGSLGLMVTATPCRLDGKGLGTCAGGYADTLVEGPNMEWLVNHGYLSRFRVLTVEHQLDMSDVKKRAGEFISADLEEIVNKPSITGDAIEHYKREAEGKKAVVFCVSVAHSKEVAQAFSLAGIKAAHIDGTTDDEIRDRAILDFADGKIDVLCQVNLFSEGFDLASIAQKDVTVDCLVDLAPTNSLVNAMQRWGRVLRPAPGKVAIILDHAGNTILRHGLPTTKRTWTLEGMKKQKRGENEKVIYCRCCPKCFTVHKPSPTCPNQDFLGTGKPCGHVYEVGSRQIEERDGELVEIDLEAINQEMEKKELRKEQGRAKTLSELLEIEKARGYKPGWAKRVFENRR